MKPLDGQLEMELHQVVMADHNAVISQPNITRAIVACSTHAGMEDKEAADAAGLDPATWSKVKSGQAYFPHLRLRRFQQRCGNWLPLQWYAHDAGFRLVRLESEMERQVRERDEEIQRLKVENSILRDVATGRQR